MILFLSCFLFHLISFCFLVCGFFQVFFSLFLTTFIFLCALVAMSNNLILTNVGSNYGFSLHIFVGPGVLASLCN